MDEGERLMDDGDKEAFAKKWAATGRVMGRTLTRDDMDANFQFLKEYPLRIVVAAIDKALKDRDPDDLFLRTAMLTGVEISQAADDLLRREPGRKVGCEKCGGTGWMIDTKPKATETQGFKQSGGQALARRCECLLAAIRAKHVEEARK